MDLIFNRYGWTYAELMGVPVDSAISVITTAVKAKQRESREAYLQSAFIGWQIQEIVKGALSNKPKPQKFDDYAKQFGLIEKIEMKKESVANNIAMSKEIVEMDRAAQRQRKGGT